jgi:hypothetical protein
MKTSQQAGIDAKVLYDINQRIDTLTRALGMVDGQVKDAVRMLVQDVQRITLHLNFVLQIVSEGKEDEEMKKKFDDFSVKYMADQKKQMDAFMKAMKEKEEADAVKEKEKGLIVT